MILKEDNIEDISRFIVLRIFISLKQLKHPFKKTLRITKIWFSTFDGRFLFKVIFWWIKYKRKGNACRLCLINTGAFVVHTLVQVGKSKDKKKTTENMP